MDCHSDIVFELPPSDTSSSPPQGVFFLIREPQIPVSVPPSREKSATASCVREMLHESLVVDQARLGWAV